MIVLERPQFRALLRGEAVSIPDEELRYRKHCIYDVGIRKVPIARAIVTKIEGDGDRIRIVLVRQRRATMLARRSSTYTDDPAKAVFGEPEAIGPEVAERMNREQRERYQADLRAFRLAVQQRSRELAEGAPRADSRRLRNLARVADAL